MHDFWHGICAILKCNDGNPMTKREEIWYAYLKIIPVVVIKNNEDEESPHLGRPQIHAFLCLDDLIFGQHMA